eukprot:Rmarinus@m.20156
MVFYFTPPDARYTIYMGKDKYENEDLIKYGWPNDLWFHVDGLSSAHVYLRLADVDQSFDDIPDDIIENCAQLVKANSIEGCKKNNVPVVYTPWSNLKKTGDMDVGQVGFHSGKKVKRTMVAKKKNEILNHLNKTKVEEHPNLQKQQEDMRIKLDRIKREEIRKQKAEEKKQAEAVKKEKEALSYDNLLLEENMRTNQYGDDVNYKDIEDDFM